MARGPKKHLKRLNAPSHWMLDKMGGKWAPRPSTGPHKLRESVPMILLLRNRLKYALNRREVVHITMEKNVKIDGKVRTDPNYPIGFMDVVEITKTNELFRMLYDVNGRFNSHRISPEEAKYKLGKVRRVELGKGGVPYLVTHDARTVRYPDPDIKVDDTVKIDLATGKITEFVRMEAGNMAMVTGGKNLGRVGVIEHTEHHPGSFDIIYVRDKRGHSFATRASNVFVIGRGVNALVTLPKRKGVKMTIMEEAKRRGLKFCLENESAQA